MNKYDYEHCRSCRAALDNYSDVFCRACRARVDGIVRKLAADLGPACAAGYYAPNYVRDRNKGAQGD